MQKRCFGSHKQRKIYENAQKRIPATSTHSQAFPTNLSNFSSAGQPRFEEEKISSASVSLDFSHSSPTAAVCKATETFCLQPDRQMRSPYGTAERTRTNFIAAYPKKGIDAGRKSSECGMNAGDTSDTCAQKACFHFWSVFLGSSPPHKRRVSVCFSESSQPQRVFFFEVFSRQALGRAKCVFRFVFLESSLP